MTDNLVFATLPSVAEEDLMGLWTPCSWRLSGISLAFHWQRQSLGCNPNPKVRRVDQERPSHRVKQGTASCADETHIVTFSNLFTPHDHTSSFLVTATLRFLFNCPKTRFSCYMSMPRP